MLWGGFLAELIDRKLVKAAVYVLILAVFSFFGIVHSASPDGNMYLPWHLAAADARIPYQITVAYLALAAMFLLLSRTRQTALPSGL
jgi:AGZA family xanthine/uracil permease-like MFS transporter